MLLVKPLSHASTVEYQVSIDASPGALLFVCERMARRPPLLCISFTTAFTSFASSSASTTSSAYKLLLLDDGDYSATTVCGVKLREKLCISVDPKVEERVDVLAQQLLRLGRVHRDVLGLLGQPGVSCALYCVPRLARPGQAVPARPPSTGLARLTYHVTAAWHGTSRAKS